MQLSSIIAIKQQRDECDFQLMSSTLCTNNHTSIENRVFFASNCIHKLEDCVVELIDDYIPKIEEALAKTNCKIPFYIFVCFISVMKNISESGTA